MWTPSAENAEERRLRERSPMNSYGGRTEMDGWMPFKFIAMMFGPMVGMALCYKAYEVITTVVANWGKVDEFYRTLPKGGGLR